MPLDKFGEKANSRSVAFKFPMRSYKFVQTIARPFLSFKTRLSGPPLIWKCFSF